MTRTPQTEQTRQTREPASQPSGIPKRPTQSLSLSERRRPNPSPRLYTWLVLASLAFTAAFSLYLSSLKLMDNDEYLSYYGDRAPTMADVVRIQLRYPISLDPPAYHLLSHLSMDLFGRNEMAMRVPALLGFLLFQIGLFLFVRRLAGPRGAIVALLLPLCSPIYFYTVVGRPYGLLLGLYGMSLVCWQSAARRHVERRPRQLALVGISITLALAITSHYFGLLILAPIVTAELARTLWRRRLDYGMAAAIVAGMASIALILPFRKAVLVYQQHYYITRVTLSIVADAYRTLFYRYLDWTPLSRHLMSAAIGIGLLVLALASLWRFRRRAAAEPPYDWVALLATAALPLFGYLFGRFVTHTMEVRYVIAWQFAVMACIGILVNRLLRRNIIFGAAIAGLLVSAWLIQKPYLTIYGVDRASKLASVRIPPELAQQILSNPNQRIYIQSLENFFTDEHYEPDPRIRERFSFLYGEQQELGWLGHNTNVITAENLAHFTPLSLVPYPQFLADPSPLLIVYHNGWEWIEQDLKARDRRLIFLGPLLRGSLAAVQPAVQHPGSLVPPANPTAAPAPVHTPRQPE